MFAPFNMGTRIIIFFFSVMVLEISFSLQFNKRRFVYNEQRQLSFLAAWIGNRSCNLGNWLKKLFLSFLRILEISLKQQ